MLAEHAAHRPERRNAHPANKHTVSVHGKHTSHPLYLNAQRWLQNRALVLAAVPIGRFWLLLHGVLRSFDALHAR